MGVSMWSAHTCDGTRRDFRPEYFRREGEDCSRCGYAIAPFECKNTRVEWNRTELTETFSGSRAWLARMNVPADGRWVAFLVAFEYESRQRGIPPVKISSEVSIVPQIYPYPSCKDISCYPTGLALVDV